jgi:hypothetical protein
MDEVIKFKKFAYGACELLFNPFVQWPTRGPFAPLLSLFLRNTFIPWYAKFGILSYVSTYLAMGSAFFFVIFEGVMSIMDPGFHDIFMIRGFDILLTCTVIFAGIGTFCNSVVFRWRRDACEKQGNIFKIMWDRLKWIPLIVLFFSAILFHLTEACFQYFFSLKVVWGATTKESSNVSFFQALKDTLWGYKWEYLLFTALLGGYSYCFWYFNIGMYRGWAMLSYCIGHLVGPIALNPRIMSLAY